jgi:hypothetical protein
MARRATLDRGLPRDADDDSGAADRPARGGRRPAARQAESPETAATWSRAQRSSVPWRGSGGRWLVWTLRVIAWAVLLVLGYRGVMAIVTGSSTTGSAPPARTQTPAAAFPSTLAEAYALQFGSVYLNFSPATAPSRSAALAAMVPASVVSASPEMGWNGAGTQTLTSDQVAGIAVHGPHTAIVTLLALISDGQSDSQIVELGVPVYASNGRIVVTGEPALLPAPKTAAPPSAPPGSTDAAASEALQVQLQPFFRAYALGQQATLSHFLVPGASVTGLGGAVTLNQINAITVPPGGTTRQITVAVLWNVPTSTTTTTGSKKHPVTQVAPASLEMTYSMTVTEQNGTWYVQSIGASSQLPGPP